MARVRRKKEVTRPCREISEITQSRWQFKDVEEQVAVINRKLKGWSNYFCLGPVSSAYGAVDNHVNRRLRRWLCKKHKVQGLGVSRFPDNYLYQTMGLVRLCVTTRNFPWATA